MAKILLLDFSDQEGRELLAEKWDVEVRETNWKSGRVESLVPSLDCRIVFFQLNLGESGSGLHVGDAPNFEVLIQEGGAVVCFLGSGEEFHLQNLIGPIPGLKLEANKQPSLVTSISSHPGGRLLDEFAPNIIKSFELFADDDESRESIALPATGLGGSEQAEVLARSYRRRPVAVSLRRGKGFLFLLPWFGEKNMDVVRFMLRQTLPALLPHLFEENPFSWVESPDYYFPALTSLFQAIQEETQRHRETILRLRNQVEELKRSEQEPYSRLLTSQAELLKQAVAHAFKYLEWPQVVDVDEYWKRVIRIKEEDLWLIDDRSGQTVEEKIRTSPLYLVVIRSGPGSAPDSDLVLLQKFKARRMREFDNTKMKAILVGNYHFRQEARRRPVPFTPDQIEEAVADGNGLMTTADLFFAIKAEKEKKLGREAILRAIREKTGLITFDF